jgi:tetratricopeptide (TPR) repeat protein
MTRSSTLSATLLLSLGLPALTGTAYAQADDREKKEERRVLKASEMEQQDVSEVYRQKAREARHESMTRLKDLLSRNTAQGTQKAEMMLRLAELYFDEFRDIKLDEDKSFQEQYDKCFNTPGCSTDAMKADYANSSKWADRAIQLYQQILQNYPQYQRADEATFFLASSLQELGKKDEAVEMYTTLVRTYEASNYRADAYVQIGEYYFDANNAYKALTAYQNATKYKDSPQYAFANYKLAWCYYNVGEHGKAIDTMKGVVAYSMTPAEGQADSKRLTLQDEALKDLVRFFADAGEMDEAYKYFNGLGRKELIRSMLQRLAGMYFEQGKFEQTIATYRRLIAEEPQSPDAPEYQNEIIQSYTKMGQKAEVENEIEKLRKTYGKSSAWARANSANQDAINEARDFLDKNLRKVANNYYLEARKLGSGARAREAYEFAGRAYAVYLEEFPQGQYAYQMRYEYGELLYEMKRFPEAYEQYMAVVAIDPKGKESVFCARSAVFAADALIKVEEKEGKIVKGDKTNKSSELPLSEWETKKLAALDQFSKLYPEDKDTKGMIYEAGFIYYYKNRFKEASDRFRTVIGMDPSSKQAMMAANLIVDSFALVEDYGNLKDVSKAFYDQKSLGDAGFKKEMYEVYENASLKIVEVTFEKDKDQVKAADAYMAFYGEFPKSANADLALNNAAAYYNKEGKVAKSMEARMGLIENFPKSKYWLSQVAFLGYDYETIADFGSSASWYEKLFATDPKFESSKDALFSAALFRQAQGDADKAIANFTKFRETYPEDPRSVAIPLDIARLHGEAGRKDESARWYQDIFTKPPAGLGYTEIFFARLKYGEHLEGQAKGKADKHWAETIAAYEALQKKGEDTGAAVAFIAEIKYKLAQPVFDRYLALKISGPGRSMNQAQTNKVLGDQLVAKAKALLEVESAYIAIVKLGVGEWGLASLVQAGKAYEDMADSLLKSYVPDYLTEDQREIYKMSLEDKAYVQVEKGVNAYSQGLEEAYKYNLYNDNTAYATRRLGELRPDDFPVLVEDLLEARFTARSGIERTFEEQP